MQRELLVRFLGDEAGEIPLTYPIDISIKGSQTLIYQDCTPSFWRYLLVLQYWFFDNSTI